MFYSLAPGRGQRGGRRGKRKTFSPALSRVDEVGDMVIALFCNRAGWKRGLGWVMGCPGAFLLDLQTRGMACSELLPRGPLLAPIPPPELAVEPFRQRITRAVFQGLFPAVVSGPKELYVVSLCYRLIGRKIRSQNVQVMAKLPQSLSVPCPATPRTSSRNSSCFSLATP